ncbi:UDP-N-acetylmuramoyl-tripeptide--D-alanyl-D-alanine ligase [bacterium]|nr:UDP-N-acetylmuramoyl-tripeptide--D-alanyl-D-alanine ligase [bacterium]
MALSLSFQELKSALSAETYPDLKLSQHVEGLEFDSREVTVGNLFVCLRGEQTHGHSFLEDVFNKGAAAALVEDPKLLHSSPFREKLFLVEDTLLSFQHLAGYWREKLQAIRIGITGSMGKTTTRALLTALLQTQGPGTASQRSYNNHVGVPYTICQANPSDQWLILEMGMNHAGELLETAAIARPHIAAITGIAPVHIEFFDGIEGIAQAKLEIARFLRPEDTLIVNSSDPVLMGELQNLLSERENEKLPSFQIRSFGEDASGDYDLHIEEATSRGEGGAEGVQVSFRSMPPSLEQEERFQVTAPVVGVHMAGNIATAVLASFLAFPQADRTTLLRGLENTVLEGGRMKLLSQGERRIIDDAYNSNPKSLLAALQVFKEMRKPEERTALILGDMAELGDASEQYHRECAEEISLLSPALLVTVGEYAHLFADGVSDETLHIHRREIPSDNEKRELFFQEILTQLENKEISFLLVKGSRSVSLEKIIRFVISES